MSDSAAISRSWSLAAGWRWWLARLGELIPAPLRRVICGPERWLIVDTGHGTDLPILIRRQDGRVQDRWQANSDDGPAVLRAQIRRRAKGARVALGLAPGQVLCRQVELPLAAEEDLLAVLGYELDRLTPFRLVDVHLGYDIIGRDRENGRLHLDLRLVPRAEVARSTSVLTAAGLNPGDVERLEVAGADKAVVIDLPRRHSKTARWHGRLNWVLFALLIGLGCYLGYRDHTLLDARLGALAAERDQLAPSVETVMALQQAIDHEEASRGELHIRRREVPLLISVLDEAAFRLPDHSWLVQIEYEAPTKEQPGRLELVGYSKIVPEVVNALSASTIFGNVSFQSPVSRDARRSSDQFHLTADIFSPENGSLR